MNALYLLTWILLNVILEGIILCPVLKSCLTLRPHDLQQDRLSYPPLSPGVCSDSCPLSQWCYLTIPCCPLLLLPSIFPSIRVFSSELAVCFRGPKYWSFSFSISLSNEFYYSFRLYHSLLSFRTQFQSCREQFPPPITGDSPDTDWVSYHLTQFWNGVGIRFCRLSVQPYKTASLALQTPVMSPDC